MLNKRGAKILPPCLILASSLLISNPATARFFGVDPVLLDDQGNEIEGNPAEGNLAMRQPWPSMMRSVYGDHKRFYDTYLGQYPGNYLTGDGAKRDEDGFYWINFSKT